MDTDYLKIFEELTEKALRTSEVDDLIDCLMRRNTSAQRLVENDIKIDEKRSEKDLLMENEVLKKLEEERQETLKGMEGLSRNRAAVRTYSSKFPFPPMPIFFDKKG